MLLLAISVQSLGTADLFLENVDPFPEIAVQAAEIAVQSLEKADPFPFEPPLALLIIAKHLQGCMPVSFWIDNCQKTGVYALPS
ncbi:hypothetical protein NBE99_10910 [Thermosynechococcus sp. HN-54]|nr:hypothetical protein NBE99_10910 [Thermosynechococcus sp. HN-54]